MEFCLLAIENFTHRRTDLFLSRSPLVTRASSYFKLGLSIIKNLNKNWNKTFLMQGSLLKGFLGEKTWFSFFIHNPFGKLKSLSSNPAARKCSPSGKLTISQSLHFPLKELNLSATSHWITQLVSSVSKPKKETLKPFVNRCQRNKRHWALATLVKCFLCRNSLTFPYQVNYSVRLKYLTQSLPEFVFFSLLLGMGRKRKKFYVKLLPAQSARVSI